MARQLRFTFFVLMLVWPGATVAQADWVPVWTAFAPFSEEGALVVRRVAAQAYPAALQSLSQADSLRRPEQVLACYTVMGISLFQLGRYDSARSCLQTAARLAEVLDRADARWISTLYQGLIQLRTGEALAAFETMTRLQLLSEASGDLLTQSKATMYLGLTLANLHHEQDALAKLEESLALMQVVGRPADIIQLKSNLAYFYIHAREFDKARDLLCDINTAFRTQPVSPLFIASLGNEALAYLKLDQLEAAAQVLTEAQGYLRDSLSYPVGELYTHTLQALVWQQSGQWGAARTALERGAPLAARLPLPVEVSQWHYVMGQQLVQERRYQAAVEAYTQALAGAKPGRELASLEDTYAALHDLYLRLGQAEEARVCFHTLIGIKDSLQQAWRSSHLALVDSRGLLAERDHRLAMLAKQREIDRLYRSLFGGIALAVVFFAVAAVFFQRYRYQWRREQAARTQAQRLATYSAELEALAFAISHTLKEPARTIGSFAGLLGRQFGDKLSPEGQEYLGFLQQGASRIHLLLIDLLRYVELMQKPGPPEPVDLNQVLAKVQQELPETQALLTADPLPVLAAHPQPWHTLFFQLLDNALKYRDPSRPLAIAIRYFRRVDQHHIQVRDNGRGIHPGHLPSLCKVFYRVPGPDIPEGTGIGLAMVAKIMSHYGGEVKVASTLGEGTTLDLYVPVAPLA